MKLKSLKLGEFKLFIPISIFFFILMVTIVSADEYGYNYLGGTDWDDIFNIPDGVEGGGDGFAKYNFTDNSFNGSGNFSLPWGYITSDTNSDGEDAIRIIGTEQSVDFQLGSPSGYFNIYNNDGSLSVLYMDNDGNMDVNGDIVAVGNIDGDNALYGGLVVADEFFGDKVTSGDNPGHTHSLFDHNVTFYYNVSMNHTYINNVSDPTADQDVATKKYVDDNSGGVAGADTQVQFNDGGVAGADAGMTFNKATNVFKLTGRLQPSNGASTSNGLWWDGTAAGDGAWIQYTNNAELEVHVGNDNTDILHLSSSGQVKIKEGLVIVGLTGTQFGSTVYDPAGALSTVLRNSDKVGLAVVDIFDPRDVLFRVSGDHQGDTITDDGVVEIFENTDPTIRFHSADYSWFDGGNLGIGTRTPSVELEVNGSLNMSGNFTGNQFYAEAFNHTEAGWNFEIATAMVHYNLSNMSAGELNGFTFTSNVSASGGGYFTTLVGGKYMISASINFDGGNTKLYELYIAKNFISNPTGKCEAMQIGTLSVTSMPVSCILDIEVGDTINLQLENEDNSQDASIHNVYINLLRVGN